MWGVWPNFVSVCVLFQGVLSAISTRFGRARTHSAHVLSGSWLAAVLCAFWPWVCCCVLMWGVWPNFVSVCVLFQGVLSAISTRFGRARTHSAHMLSGSWLAAVLCVFWPWVCCCVLMWGVWPNSVSVFVLFQGVLSPIST
jgi:hypothetical protein